MTPRVRIVPGHGSGHLVEVYVPIAPADPNAGPPATVDCAWCSGRGKTRTVRAIPPVSGENGPDYVIDQARCPECGGTGRVVVAG